MKYALISDIHSKYRNIEDVLNHISMHNGIDAIINLGDSLEVKISKTQMETFNYQNLSQIIDYNDIILEVMRPGCFLIGNQEERIRKIVPEVDETGLGKVLLSGQEKIELKSAILTHGHFFDWINPYESVWYPQVDEIPKKNLIYGHNHQNALFELMEIKGGILYRPISIKYGATIQLQEDKRYLINVGDIKNSYPNWVLYDENEKFLIYNKLFANGQWNRGNYGYK